MTQLVERHFTGRGCGLEFEMEADWVKRHVRPDLGRVIDVGCGIGALLDAIDVSNAIGIDYSIDGLARTRERFRQMPLVCSDAAALPLTDNSVGTVLVQHVIEHMAESEYACREWSRVLAPGGTILILTPNRMFGDQSVYEDDTHVEIFDAPRLRQLLTHEQFEIVELRTLGLDWFRRYHGRSGMWRLRRMVVDNARLLSTPPILRWKGQTLCCAARKPSR